MPNIRHSLQSLADALSPDTNTHDGYVDNAETSLTRIADALPKKLGGKIEAESLAAEYDDQATYDIGDYCTHDGVFYICATAIAIAESWNSAKWVAVPLIEILQEKLNAPADGAVAGRYLMVGQNGEPVWDQLDESDIRQSVYDWLSAHPEAIVVNDGTITRAKLDSSVGQAVDDVSTLKADFLQLPTDGVTANAKQLLSSNGTDDTEPYMFRAVPVNADRAELDAVVGGSLVANQLVQNGDFSSADVWEDTQSVYQTAINNNTLIATVGTNTTITSSIIGNVLHTIAGHKYFASIDANYSKIPEAMSASNKLFFGSGGYDGIFGIVSAINVWNRISGVFSRGTGGTDVVAIYPRFRSSSDAGESVQFRNAIIIDLTAMFGPTIADYIYSLEQATPGAGVAWFRKYYPNDYYPFDAGTLKSVEGVSAHGTVGFNAWDFETDNIGKNLTANGVLQTAASYNTSDYIKVIPKTQYYLKNVPGSSYAFAGAWYDINKNFISIIAIPGNSYVVSAIKESPENAYYVRLTRRRTEAAANEACINLSDSAKNGTYEPYVRHSYALDPTVVIRGIPKLADGKLTYDGDRYLPDGTVERRYGIVDLGTLDWAYVANSAFNMRSNNNIGAMPAENASAIPNAICSELPVLDYTTLSGGVVGVTVIFAQSAQAGKIWAHSDLTDATAFKTAMSGVMLVYELATPTTETATPYQSLQVCDPNGTEEFVSTGIVPVGHETRYPENLRAKIEGLPWDFSTLIAPTESGTASRNYTTGSLLIMGNVLYKVTANIANGGNIVPGTNVTATTLSEVISALQ